MSMDSEQPYSPPQSDVSGPPAGISNGGGSNTISPGILDNLRKTRPWVLLMGVVIMLGCVLMVLFGILMTAMAGFGGADFGPVGGAVLGVLYLLMAVLYFFPGLYLLRFAGSLKRLGQSNTAAAVEAALAYQLRFWRFLGILTIAVIVLYIVLIAAGILIGIFAAATG